MPPTRANKSTKGKRKGVAGTNDDALGHSGKRGQKQAAADGASQKPAKTKAQSELRQHVKKILLEEASDAELNCACCSIGLQDERLSEEANVVMAEIMKTVSTKVLRQVELLEQQHNEISQNESDLDTQELLKLDEATLKKRLKDLEAQEAQESARLESYRKARHEVERRERDEYHKLHPLVRDLHPEMGKAIVDVSDQPFWLRKAVREFDSELHRREQEQSLHLDSYSPSGDEWLQSLLNEYADIRDVLHSVGDLRELDSLIETGLRVV